MLSGIGSKRRLIMSQLYWDAANDKAYRTIGLTNDLLCMKVKEVSVKTGRANKNASIQTYTFIEWCEFAKTLTEVHKVDIIPYLKSLRTRLITQ